MGEKKDRVYRVELFISRVNRDKQRNLRAKSETEGSSRNGNQRWKTANSRVNRNQEEEKKGGGRGGGRSRGGATNAKNRVNKQNGHMTLIFIFVVDFFYFICLFIFIF